MRGRFLTLVFIFCFSGLALAQSISSPALSEWGLHEAFAFIVVGTIVANAYVVGLFHAAKAGTSSRWAAKWEFSPRATVFLELAVAVSRIADDPLDLL